MGSGDARQRILHDRSGRRVHKYERQNKQLREEIARLCCVIDEREHAIAGAAQEEIARLSAELLMTDAKRRDVEARAPDLIEVHDVRGRGFLGRLWWALGFARTGRMRYERM